jgi:hypothetical protein
MFGECYYDSNLANNGDVNGGFSCQCKTGYTGDGYSNLDTIGGDKLGKTGCCKDECLTMSNCQTLQNTLGTGNIDVCTQCGDCPSSTTSCNPYGEPGAEKWHDVCDYKCDSLTDNHVD